jgi:DedD protein
VPGKKVLFNSVKVAHVEIPPFPKAPEKIASAEPIKLVTPALASQLAKLEIPPVKLRKKPLVMPSAKISKVISMHLNNDRYGVQLASFSQQINAQQLVNRLRQHGYTASYTPIQGNKGRAIYKVVVGSLAQKEAALILQKKLATNLKLSGFIVKMA